MLWRRPVNVPGLSTIHVSEDCEQFCAADGGEVTVYAVKQGYVIRDDG